MCTNANLTKRTSEASTTSTRNNATRLPVFLYGTEVQTTRTAVYSTLPQLLSTISVVYRVEIGATTTTAAAAAERRGSSTAVPAVPSTGPGTTVSVVPNLEVKSTTSLATLFHQPVPKAMPKIPLRNPVLFIDVRQVSARGIVTPRIRWGIVDHCQSFSMLGCFRNLIPLVWCLCRRVGSRLLGQIERVTTQSIPRGLGFLEKISVDLFVDA